MPELPITKALNEDYFHVAGEYRSDGTCKTWRRTGMTKTWKTRPGEYRIPVHYGMRARDHGYITHGMDVHLERECTNPKRRG